MVYALIVIFTLLYHLNNLDISILLTTIRISKLNDIRDIQQTAQTEYSVGSRWAHKMKFPIIYN
jgi:hypothetical protein